MPGENVQALAWDSNWLGFPVARFVVEGADEVAIAVAQCRAEGVRLLYLVLDPTDTVAAAATAAGALLADVKLSYEKQLSAPTMPFVPPVGTVLALATATTPQLEALALQSGEYSRFRRDIRIGTQAFEELYAHWLGKALSNGRVWAASKANDTVGLLAFGVRGGKASIELLAVAPTARRQHIGQCLVQLAEQEAQHQGYTMLQVVTQGANRPARHFYERCGFQVRQTEHIYHLWL